MPDEKGPMSEAEFIAIAGAEKPDKANESPDPSRPLEPAKAIEEPKTTETEEPDKGSDPAAKGSTDSADKTPKGAHDAGDGSATEGEDGEEDQPLTDEAFDAEFTKALEAEGASPSLEDIPEAARPIVAKKLKDLEAGFTRATQKLSEERKGAIAFRAEERFRKEQPAHFIVAMLRENPKLSEAINKIIEDTDGNETAVEGHKALVERERQKATTAEEKDLAKGAEGAARVEQVIKLGRAAARAAGVPFEMGVEEAIATHMLIHDGAISDAEIRTIAQTKAAVYKRQLRQTRRDASGQYVKDKVDDRKKSGLRVPPGKGTAPAPAGRKMAKNDQEFIDEFAGRSA